MTIQRLGSFLAPLAAAVLLPAMFLLAQPPDAEEPASEETPNRPRQPGLEQNETPPNLENSRREFRPERPGGGAFGPTDRLTGIRSQIGATEEEWQVIGPLLQSVVATRRSLQTENTNRGGGMFGGFFGGGRPGGFGGPLAGANAGGANPESETNRPRGGSFNGPGGFPGGGFGPPRTADSPRPEPPPGGFGGGGSFGNSPVAQAQNELKAALASQTTTADELAAKVAAVRATREEAKQKLSKLQDELKLLLTARQEAILVGDGYLD